MTVKFLQFIIVLMFICGCKKHQTELTYTKSLEYVAQQMEKLCGVAMKNNRIPRTLNEQGEIHWTRLKFDWTEGFFPGSCWYLYEITNNESFKNNAKTFQSYYKEHRFYTTNHDLGFIFNCSFGNEYRITESKEAREVLIDAANSLITRYNPHVGCLQSWDVDKGWQAKRGWQFPVIIDNMMNLELLFKVSEITGDKKYRDIAIAHANTTLKNHFRSDGSSYHVVDYDKATGELRSRQTAQGYAHESAWARGQAWGLYGYTVCYRYTRDLKYLQKAEEIAYFLLSHDNLPSDLIPVWDFDVPLVEKEYRDVSAAAIMASALLELDKFSGYDYLEKAIAIIDVLSTEKYRSGAGENQNFILKHSVGSIPHNNEIDVPLVYADYYYIEALVRLKKLEEKQKALG